MKRRWVMVDANKFVEVLTKMVYSECKKRGLYPDEDLVQDVLMTGWDALRRLYFESRGVKWTTYLWTVVDSCLKDWLRKEVRNVYLDELREGKDGEARDWYLEDVRGESFSSRLLGLLDKYSSSSLVGEDFLKLIVSDVDISNALRSISVSKKRGEEWIEWWLGRKLTQIERMCCQEVRELLQEV
jgi:hypothetical protein